MHSNVHRLPGSLPVGLRRDARDNDRATREAERYSATKSRRDHDADRQPSGVAFGFSSG